MPKISTIKKEQIFDNLLAQIDYALQSNDEQVYLDLLQILPDSFAGLPQETRIILIKAFCEHVPKACIKSLPLLLATLPEEDRAMHISPSILQTLALKAPEKLSSFMAVFINLIPEKDRHGLIMPDW